MTIPLPAGETRRKAIINDVAELTADADDRTLIEDCIRITTLDYNLAQKIKAVLHDADNLFYRKHETEMER